MAAIISGALGAALLFIGRRLFWFFVGAIGFGIGLRLAERMWPGPGLVSLVVALVVGVVFALLAVFLQSVAIGAAGFFAGGYVLLTLGGLFGVDRGILAWIIFILGGILGAILVGALLDWALITLSSLTGASMIVHALERGGGTGGVIMLVLFIIGIVVQGAALRNERRAAAQDA